MGPKSVASSAPDPVDSNTIFTLASVTKLPTTIAALQQVEQGRIQLDDDVTELLPFLRQQKILSGFDDTGKPILKDRNGPITLRHLLTHASGVGYSFLSSAEKLQKYNTYTGRAPGQGSTVETRFDLPLLYEPGESWAYGAGIDWAGQVVEQLSGLSLEEYFNEHIWKPLGASSTFTFFPSKGKSAKQHLATLASRTAESQQLKALPEGFDLNRGLEECFGGQGGYGRAEDVLKLLHSLLANDGRVLQPKTVDMMFQGQLSQPSKTALKESLEGPAWAVGDYYADEEYNWGLGGILIEKPSSAAPYTRGVNTLIWSGAPNIFWVRSFNVREKLSADFF